MPENSRKTRRGVLLQVLDFFHRDGWEFLRYVLLYDHDLQKITLAFVQYDTFDHEISGTRQRSQALLSLCVSAQDENHAGPSFMKSSR